MSTRTRETLRFDLVLTALLCLNVIWMSLELQVKLLLCLWCVFVGGRRGGAGVLLSIRCCFVGRASGCSIRIVAMRALELSFSAGLGMYNH